MTLQQLQLISDSHSLQVISASNASSDTDVGSSTSTFTLSSPQQLFATTSGKRHTSKPKVLSFGKSSAKWTEFSSYMALCRHWDDWKSEYGLLGHWRLPYFISAYAIAVQAQASFSVFHWPKICCTISVRNIVPGDSEFMTACSKGNLSDVRRLALARRGGPTDVDEYGQPAIHVRSLHTEVLSLS